MSRKEIKGFEGRRKTWLYTRAVHVRPRKLCSRPQIWGTRGLVSRVSRWRIERDALTRVKWKVVNFGDAKGKEKTRAAHYETTFSLSRVSSFRFFLRETRHIIRVSVDKWIIIGWCDNSYWIICRKDWNHMYTYVEEMILAISLFRDMRSRIQSG